MALKTFPVIFILGVVALSNAKIESNFHYEEPCAAKHGVCVLKEECPNNVTDEYKELCSGQAKSGAICCKDFPQKEVNCRQSYNECMESCPERLDLGKMGCHEGTTCCALIV